MNVLRPLVGLMLVFLVACGEHPTTPPRLNADVEAIELGAIPWGERFERRVRLRNDGSRPIIVRGGATSCGCAKVIEAPSEISPGAEADVVIAFRMELPAGAWLAPLIIDHDGVDAPLRIPMSARLRPAWSFRDDSDFRAVAPGTTIQDTLRLRTRHESAPRVLELRSSEEGLTAGPLRPEDGEPGAFAIPFTLRAAQRAGFHRAEINVFCPPGDPHQRLRIPLEYWVEGEVDATPRRLAFPGANVGERRLVLTDPTGDELVFISASAQGVPLKVVDVEDGTAVMTLKLNAQAPVNSGRLRVSFERGGRKETLSIGLRSRDEVGP